MQRKGFSLIELLLAVGLLALLAAVLFPMFVRPRREHRGNCMNNYKQLGLGLAQYNQDFDGRLPPIVGSQAPMEGAPYGWADAIYPYIRNTQVYRCPLTRNYGNSTVDSGSPTARNYTDFWFNTNMAGVDTCKIAKPARRLVLGEGNDGRDATDARYNYSALPPSWLNNNNSPLYRHDEAANYGFLDGHVKRMTPEMINGITATFAPR